jgi:hypothetical protein
MEKNAEKMFKRSELKGDQVTSAQARGGHQYVPDPNLIGKLPW